MVGNALTYSDIIATLALISSIITIWYVYKTRQDNFPQITIEEKTPAGGPFFSKDDEKWKYFLCYEFSCTNHGGRKASLLSIEPFNEGPPPITKIFAKLFHLKASTLSFLLVAKEGRLINSKIDYSISRLQEKINDISSLSSTIIDSYFNQGSKELIYLNQNIEPGVTEYLTFGLIFDCYGPNKTAKNDIDTIFITFRLLFNNKQEHVFRRAIHIPSI